MHPRLAFRAPADAEASAGGTRRCGGGGVHPATLPPGAGRRNAMQRCGAGADVIT